MPNESNIVFNFCGTWRLSLYESYFSSCDISKNVAKHRRDLEGATVTASYEIWPPYNIDDKFGKPRGILSDIFEHFSYALNFTAR